MMEFEQAAVLRDGNTNMHEQLWEKLVGLDPTETARRSGCRFDGDSSTFIVPLMGADFVVDGGQRLIAPADDPETQAGFLEQLCILAYLINASDIPVSGKLVSGEKLEAGQFFFRGPHGLPTPKLEEAFGDEPSLLDEACARLNAEPCEYGDASLSIRILPNVPIVFIIWGGDDEFEARASILFDETASRQLPLDALLAGVQLAVKKLIEAVK
ncbi:MAG: hypothetical protein DRP66_08620 [Planctomycetota bacterium]|nr:MAG: hypothetical protein DRP66_08620 [Planctomycetota bacterium]